MRQRSPKYDLTGQRFGHLIAKAISSMRQGVAQKLVWECLCDCGNTTFLTATKLRGGLTKSCGCSRSDAVRGSNHWIAKKNLEAYGGWVSRADNLYTVAAGILERSKKRNIPTDFNNAQELALYLKEISPEVCPVFKTPLIKGTRRDQRFSPSVDKIDPKKGYVRGNMQILSKLANTMKSDASTEELKHFANWILEKEEDEE